MCCLFSIQTPSERAAAPTKTRVKVTAASNFIQLILLSCFAHFLICVGAILNSKKNISAVVDDALRCWTAKSTNNGPRSNSGMFVSGNAEHTHDKHSRKGWFATIRP